MPKNKSAVIRYRAIDKRIRRRFRPFPRIEDIIEAIEEVTGDTISLSSVQKDISAMKNDPALGYFAPIKYDRERKGYYYEDPEYSIEHVNLDASEEDAIRFAVNLLNQYKNVPALEHFEGAIQKIFEKVSVDRLNPDFPVIDFEKAPGFKGTEFISPLADHIIHREPVRISYQKFGSDKASDYVIHPYLLKEYSNRWYLVGLDEQRTEIRTFGLDRIATVKAEPELPFRKGNFSPDEYFRYSFGITASDRDKAEEVRLLFSPRAANYIKTLPLHESQELLDENEKGCSVKIFVQPTVELTRTILSYGNQVKVISPKWLKEEVKSNTYSE